MLIGWLLLTELLAAQNIARTSISWYCHIKKRYYLFKRNFHCGGKVARPAKSLAADNISQRFFWKIMSKYGNYIRSEIATRLRGVPSRYKRPVLGRSFEATQSDKAPRL
jgi:hypothetical protein